MLARALATLDHILKGQKELVEDRSRYWEKGLRLLSVAVDRWGSNTAMPKAERVEEERRFRITNRIIRRVLNRSLASAWECWCHTVHLIMYEREEDQRRQRADFVELRGEGEPTRLGGFAPPVGRRPAPRPQRRCTRKPVS